MEMISECEQEDSFADALKRQQAKEISDNDAQFMDGVAAYDRLDDEGTIQEQGMQRNRIMALAGAMNSARKHGGKVSPYLYKSLSAAFGKPITSGMLIDSGENMGTLVFGTQQKDASGQIVNVPAMAVSPEMRYRLFKGIPSLTPYLQADYQIIRRSSGLNDDQLSAMGIVKPSSYQYTMPQSANSSLNIVGSTGAFKRPIAERHGVHVFAADGKGGFTRAEWTPEERYRQVGEGTRDKNYNGRWKVVSVGPSDTFDGGNDKTQVRVYENDKTGERVRVKDGENLRDVLAKSQKSSTGNSGGNWHENVARINADSREKIAQMNNGTKEKVANIMVDGKIKVAETGANALLEKTQMQIDSYAEKNLTDKQIAEARNDANKWIAELKSKTTLSKSDIETKSKERISTAHDEAQKAISEGKSDAWLMGKQLEYDAKIEAIEASKMSSEAKNKLTERLAAEKNAITLEVAQMRKEVDEDKLDLGWEKLDSENEANKVKQQQDQQKIDNEKEYMEEKLKLQRDLAELKSRVGRSGSTVSTSRIKEINQELNALGKIIENGKPEDRKDAKDRITALSNELNGKKSDKGTIKTDYNTDSDAFKRLSRDKFDELARTDPEKARAYLDELKKRKSSK